MRDNRIKMPVAKAVNVTVDFNYKNFDFELRNSEDKHKYRRIL